MQIPIAVIGPDGQVRHRTKALVTANLAVIEDAKTPIEVGDEIRRTIPNGLEEVFEVVDPVFYPRGPGMGPHLRAGRSALSF